ncbi:hypothetical protein GE21DRAFT_3042 [Neurospora crassa]|uniref:Uncharacterized protein n=2 Tax=Neurospora crassa TaxID=5141 RepID=Q7SCA2_NEUCR|nr:hypothetical protein NCU05483 [Neurospora crassa OR74A]EAA34238.1 hypothetical protein NCU05483 [Neurospora crassa OR74A]KHE85216.1 hypothetical protein GE21DRAFT_3042 [Neurospora crassa]CAE55942.1 hypothetical protein [Neurospora crassa]|eukprot:XP_963474.1 hypothetical protein NCU05483 [Neurospora crassa OR74A]
MGMSQPFAICSICSLMGPLSMRSMGRLRVVHEVDKTTRRSDENVAAFGRSLHVLLVRWPSRLWHSPVTATGRAHLPSSPLKLKSGSGQSERGGNIVIVKVVEKVYLTSPPGVGVGNWGWGRVVGLFHRTIHLLNRKSTNSEANLVKAGSQASVLLLAEEKSPTPPESRRWNSPHQMERSTTTTTAAKPRGSTVKKANYIEPQTTTDKSESAVSVDYDALDDSPTGHLAKKQRTTPLPATSSTHHSLGRPLPQPAPFGEVKYYQDKYEEKKTSEPQKPNSSKSQDNTRGSAQRPRVQSPIALRMSPLPVPTTRPITRPNLKASLLYRLTSSVATTELAASLAYTRATVPVYPTNSNSDFEKLKALRKFKAVSGPHPKRGRSQLFRDLAAIRPLPNGHQGSGQYLKAFRNRVELLPLCRGNRSHASDWSRRKRPEHNTLGRPSSPLLHQTIP